MRILFSPEFSGNVYTAIDKANNILMDTITVDTMGLVAILELQLGMYYPELVEHQRTVLFYTAMNKYMAKHPKNILSQSFKLSGLSTAASALKWRDALVMNDWDVTHSTQSERLTVLKGVEEYFDSHGLPDRLIKILTTLEEQKDFSCADNEIVLPCSTDILHPKVQKLLKAMGQHGATIKKLPQETKSTNNLSIIRDLLTSDSNKKIALDEKDDSFKIYKFDNERFADEYMAYKGDMENADVWINGSNKAMDNWLRMMGKPTMGSSMVDSAPQIVQLFVLGISLFEQPLNMRTLIDWLYVPVHPLQPKFRYKLAETIIAEGGYRNEKCQTVINDYLDGQYLFTDENEANLPEDELKKLKEKRKRQRKELAELYLPSQNSETTEDIDTDKLRIFINSLSSWARQRAHLIAEDNDKQLWVSQLIKLADMSDTFILLMDNITSKTIDYKIVDSWISTLYKADSFVQYQPQKGCRTLINSPAKMAAVANKTIWMNVDGDESNKLDCNFLFPSERIELASEMTFWNENLENQYHNSMLLQPFSHTKDQLILTMCDYREGTLTQKHPIMVRLENQITNIDKFIFRPNLNSEERVEVENTQNEILISELNFEHTSPIKWPQAMSPTLIEALIQNPFDFVMERILGIGSTSPSQMADIKTTKGNVAHAVIAQLFAPRENEQFAQPNNIEQRIATEYNDTLRNTIEAHGAIFYLPENKLDAKLLNEQLHTCLNTLIDILKANRLKVTGCERNVSQNIGLNDNDDDDMHGFIDMTLSDENGNPLVFDFKWTTSRHYYQDLLTKNRSVQLELYRHMIEMETKLNVKRTAYFLMPEGRLYSKLEFAGDHCVQLKPESDNDIIEQIKNSYHYRIQQIDNGTIEINEGLEIETLAYVKDTEAKNLLPLSVDNSDKKIKSKYSNYVLFKCIDE